MSEPTLDQPTGDAEDWAGPDAGPDQPETAESDATDTVTLATVLQNYQLGSHDDLFPVVTNAGTEMTRKQADLALAEAGKLGLEIKEM